VQSQVSLHGFLKPSSSSVIAHLVWERERSCCSDFMFSARRTLSLTAMTLNTGKACSFGQTHHHSIRSYSNH